MKAMQSAKPELWLIFFFLLAFCSPAWAQQNPSAASDVIAKRLDRIEKELSEAKTREQKILDNQAVLLEEIRKTRTWLSRR